MANEETGFGTIKCCVAHLLHERQGWFIRRAAHFAMSNCSPATDQFRRRKATSTVIAMHSGGWYL